MAKKSSYENLERAKSVTGIDPRARVKEIRQLEYRRMSLASAMEVLLDDYRRAGGKNAPGPRRRKVGKGQNDYRP